MRKILAWIKALFTRRQKERATKVYALTNTYHVDNYTRNGHTATFYAAFFSTEELAKKANKDKFYNLYKITEIALDVIEKSYDDLCADDDGDDDWDDEDEDE